MPFSSDCGSCQGGDSMGTRHANGLIIRTSPHFSDVALLLPIKPARFNGSEFFTVLTFFFFGDRQDG